MVKIYGAVTPVFPEGPAAFAESGQAQYGRSLSLAAYEESLAIMRKLAAAAAVHMRVNRRPLSASGSASFRSSA
jgi:hypothetical protein